jgi:hypothetical protein
MLFHRSISLPGGDIVQTVRVDFSTGVIINSPLASLGLAGTHPIDLNPASANLKRWPHLPRYKDYVAYVKRKAQGSLKEWSNSVPEMLKSSRSRNIFIAAEQWATVVPGVVDELSLYQHPKLQKKNTGKLNATVHYCIGIVAMHYCTTWQYVTAASPQSNITTSQHHHNSITADNNNTSATPHIT